MLGRPGTLLGIRTLGPRYVGLVGPDFLSGLASLSRAQLSGVESTAVESNGATWQRFAADTPRFNGVGRGLLVEGQRTNAIPNPRAEGLVPGSPGTLPTQWSQQALQGGLSRTLGAVSLSGLDGISCRVSGTASNTTPTNVEFATSRAAAPAASPSQRRVTSVLMRLAPGSSLTNISNVALSVLGLTTAGVAVTGNQPQLSVIGQLDTTLRRFVLPVTFTSDVTIARSISRVLITAVNGAAVDCTVEIYWPQDEVDASIVSTPILPPVGALGASTRGSDVLSVALSGLGVSSSGAGIYRGRFTLPQSAPSTTVQMILQVDDGTDNNRWLVRNEAGGPFLSLYRVVSGAFSIAGVMGTVTPGVPFDLSLILDGSGRGTALLDAQAPVFFTGGVTSGLTRCLVGSSGLTGGVEAMFGEVHSLEIAAL